MEAHRTILAEPAAPTRMIKVNQLRMGQRDNQGTSLTRSLNDKRVCAEHVATFVNDYPDTDMAFPHLPFGPAAEPCAAIDSWTTLAIPSSFPVLPVRDLRHHLHRPWLPCCPVSCTLQPPRPSSFTRYIPPLPRHSDQGPA
jgi:hypothetical protein